jgi:hypothetical protein
MRRTQIDLARLTAPAPGAGSSALASDAGAVVPAITAGTGVLFEDDFAREVSRGKVIGSSARCGQRRQGIDVERVLEIRDGALRIHPLAQPGWSRAAISYGAYCRRNGLGFATHLLNGHNGSAPYRLQSLIRRIARWLLGSGTDPLVRRVLRFPFRVRRESSWRRLRRWARNTRATVSAEGLEGNLAVGWFSERTPGNPTRRGNCWLVRGAGPENGHLLCRSHGSLLLASSRLTNVPVHYIVILREIGAAYYLASLSEVPGAAPFPHMRPVAIDTLEDDQLVHPGLQQSAVGEIGFSVESVVYGARVADVPGLGQWYGTAHAADCLRGEGLLSGSPADTGGVWGCPQGDFRRANHGIAACAPRCFAILWPNATSGLIHAVVQPRGHRGHICLVWRAADEANHWRLRLDRQGCHLEALVDGAVAVSRSDPGGALQPDRRTAVQITDDGTTINIHLDGRHRRALSMRDRTHADAVGVGLATEAGAADLFVAVFEAHPRLVEIPPALRLDAAWSQYGTHVVVRDRFAARRRDLAGHEGTAGFVWQKLMGSDRFALDGRGVQVVATSEAPVRGRVAYGIEWPDPDFADVTTRIVPPGSGEDKPQKGRGGLIFWQDNANYIIVNTWLDNTAGEYQNRGATSSFFYLKGFEDVYDAVWTNLADRIRPGEPYDLRIVFDGLRYRVHVNEEPVLYRALDDVYPRFGGLSIRRVGIVANWEWGHDTGSRFLTFSARRRAQPDDCVREQSSQSHSTRALPNLP